MPTQTSVHELAGQPAPLESLINVPRLVTAFYAVRPDPAVVQQRVAFGTSGHRGSSVRGSFNEDHILAVSQAICDFRKKEGINGPLFLGMDTHALSEPAHAVALEVLAANSVETRISRGLEFTPTPVVSHAILSFNHGRKSGCADGIVMTPSHNPPEDGGIKYNPPHGGPADNSTTRWIEDRANLILEGKSPEAQRILYERALSAPTVCEFDYLDHYTADLEAVVDLEKVRSAGIRLGADPMGGSGTRFWNRISERYGLDLTVVNPRLDASFSFMPLDHDGKIRMDCSSPYAMARLIEMKEEFDIAFGNDPDFDRHGIVTRSSGLMNPNHYLAVCVWYLFQNRTGWPPRARVGKTLVSSSIIDRVAVHLRRELAEVPVGFKWFVDGLLKGEYGFAGEESAGASFLRRNGTVWTTDKDGFIMGLLAAEMTAATGKDPSRHYQNLTEIFGNPAYQRIDVPATREEKAILGRLSPDQIRTSELAGEKILVKLTQAPANGAPIGGLKVGTRNGWFAARPSGTEEVYKIYAESFRGPDHLRRIQAEAMEIVSAALRGNQRTGS